jgi:hypothetical protein
LMLSTPRGPVVVSTKLLKVPENEAGPSPFGKLPGGTEEVKTDVPTRVELSNACTVNGAEGRPPVAKLKEALDRVDEKPTLIGPSWPGVQTPWIRAFPERVAKLSPATLQTET